MYDSNISIGKSNHDIAQPTKLGKADFTRLSGSIDMERYRIAAPVVTPLRATIASDCTTDSG